MRKFAVMVPFAGHFYIEVEAENEQDAKCLAFNANIFDPESGADVCEIEYYEQMNKGNVSYCTLSEVDIQEIEKETK